MKETSRSENEELEDFGYHLVIQNNNDLNDRFRDQPFPLWISKEMHDFNKYIFKDSHET